MNPNANAPAPDEFDRDDPLLELYRVATAPPPMPAHLAYPFAERIRAEVASALDLLDHPLVLNARKVADWVCARVGWTNTLPTDVARQLLLCVAKTIRAVRSSACVVPSAGSTALVEEMVNETKTPTGTGSRASHGVDDCSIIDWARRIGPVTDAVAVASRGLEDDEDDSMLAEVFALSAYAGRTDDELAKLFGTSATEVAETRTFAENLVRAIAERQLDTRIGAPGGTADDTAPSTGVVPVAEIHSGE
jgi:hypothetical protein